MRKGAEQRLDDAVRVIGVGYAVHDGDQHERDRLGEVQGRGGRLEDLTGIASVRADVRAAALW
jgi:hypothetical protein